MIDDLSGELLLLPLLRVKAKDEVGREFRCGPTSMLSTRSPRRRSRDPASLQKRETTSALVVSSTWISNSGSAPCLATIAFNSHVQLECTSTKLKFTWRACAGGRWRAHNVTLNSLRRTAPELRNRSKCVFHKVEESAKWRRSGQTCQS